MSNEFGDVRVVNGNKPQPALPSGVLLLNFLKQQIGFSKKAATCGNCRHWEHTRSNSLVGRCTLIQALPFKSEASSSCRKHASVATETEVDTNEQRVFKELLVAAELDQSIDVGVVLSILVESHRDKLIDAVKTIQLNTETMSQQETVNADEDQKDSSASADASQEIVADGNA